MLIFHTYFPVNPDATVDMLLGLGVEWRLESPHSQLRDIVGSSSFDVCNLNLRNKDEHLVTQKCAYSGIEIGGVRSAVIENGDTVWTTEIVGVKKGNESYWINVKIFCNSMKLTSLEPKVNKPYIIKLINNKMARGYDTNICTNGSPIFLKDNHEDLVFVQNVINGVYDVVMPCVVISRFKNNSLVLDPGYLARKLYGMAHVIVEPRYGFIRQVVQEVGFRHPYNGAVGIYMFGCEDHWKIIPDDNYDSKVVTGAIFHKIRKILIMQPPAQKCSWIYLQECISNQKIEELRNRGPSDDVATYCAVFDEEMREKNLEIERLNIELAKIRRIDLNKESSESAKGILFYGEEEEKFPGEIKDVIIELLGNCFNYTSGHPRRQDILRDILDHNKPTGELERRGAEVKEIFRSYTRITPEITKRLKTLGFVINDGAHHKISYEDDDRYTSIISKTGSDHRGGLNTAADIKKVFY